MSDQRCLFCRIIAKEIPAKIVHEDDQIVAFEDINPQAPTHVLVIPREHVPTLDAMSPAHASLIGAAVHRATEIARERKLEKDGYRVVANCGEAAGQTVFHIHFHLLGGRSFSWPPG